MSYEKMYHLILLGSNSYVNYYYQKVFRKHCKDDKVGIEHSRIVG